jgi:hypothetical protein
MAVAIGSISGVSSSDNGKVVVDGQLTQQTSRSVSQNGTYDTTTNDEVVVNVSGGGSTNILSGSTVPTASDGEDGDVYLQYVDNTALLPSGYIGYNSLLVGNSAGPYIDTDITTNLMDGFELKFRFTNAQTNDTWIFGNWVSYKDTLIGCYGGKWRIMVGGQGPTNLDIDYDVHVAKVDTGHIYLDGVDTGYVPNWSNVPSGKLLLFKDTGHKTPVKNAEVYRLIISSNGTTVRDMVPCKRESDDKLGFYDLINDVFYENAGSGSFIAGADAGRSIVSAYLKVDGSWLPLIGQDIADVNLGD